MSSPAQSKATGHLADHRATRLFLALAGFFVTDALLAEFVGVKIFSLERTVGIADIQWHLLGVSGSLSFTAGVIYWPLVFVLTDLINEYYGRRGVRLVSWLAVIFISWAFFAAYIAIRLAPAQFWVDANAELGVPDIQRAYALIFGQGMWTIVGSIVAFLVGQLIDVTVFHRIRRLTGEKWMWLRATGSTAVSQLFDSFIVLYIAFVLGPQHWPTAQFLAVGAVNYAYKMLAAVVVIPLLYLVHAGVRRYLGNAEVEKLRHEGGTVKRAWDEMIGADGRARKHCREYSDWLLAQGMDRLAARSAEADALFHRFGITFAVYGQAEGTERLIPFDVVPRVLPQDEWLLLEAGLKQRVSALNAFIADVYDGQDILRAGVIPAEQVLGNSQYRPEVQGIVVPQRIYAHIAGIDVIRDDAGRFLVLEDNLRVPSGVSYMLENRRMMMRLFPELFVRCQVAPVEGYPEVLLNNLNSVAPRGVDHPVVVLLTPGAYNSAYFEHAFLAQQMGIELVEGQDLFVRDEIVFMRTTRGPQRVDVIYRRIDDDFLDPRVFRADSTLGCAGLMGAWRAGNVTIANAVGTGIADDKSIYPYVPEMIRFYLGEEPLIDNVPTRVLRRPEDLAYTLAHLDELVVKEVHGAGGYGMLIGPMASKEEIANFRERIIADPARYIAQPTLALSTCPTLAKDGLAPRHVDLRPFVLSGKETTIVPGGLTRVALREGSLVVNSSQGGGTKDTWVLERQDA